MRQKKVTFAKNIFRNSSLKDIEVFIHKLIAEFEITLINSGLEGDLIPSSLLPYQPIKIKVQDKCGTSYANAIEINIYIKPFKDFIVFREYKRYEKDQIIGSLLFVSFQDKIMALVAHEYAHFVQSNIYKDTKPHGKEFQAIYKILRVYTNSFLADYTVVGFSMNHRSLVQVIDDFKDNYERYESDINN